MKNTKTRKMVLELLKNTNSPLSANLIFEKLKDCQITLSSIYRTLETFTNEKIVFKDTNQKGVAIYTLQKENHLHYLECKICHKKIQLDYCPYHKINEQLEKKYNFEVDEHNVVIYGTCNNCNE